MFTATTYRSRRQQLMKTLGKGLILLPGNEEVGMNYAGNPYPFRQDSTFLYYFGADRPGFIGLIDADAGEAILAGDDPTVEDMVWTGPQPDLRQWSERSGTDRTLSREGAVNRIREALRKGQAVHFLPPYRFRKRRWLEATLEVRGTDLDERVSESLIRAVVAQRSVKSAVEIAEMEKALTATHAMHVHVMEQARPGMVERQLAGPVQGLAAAAGGLAYPVILSVRGEVLHNHHHDNVLRSGQLLLGDFGAQSVSNYAGDITRTIPVAATFDQRQRDLYALVLDAQMQAIDACRPGVPYRDIHLLAARIMAAGLKDLGLMRGDTDEAVAQGAHALFFPHGLGHMIGLDVHDMEDLGEDLVGYSKEIQRSDQFGTAYLRLGRKLEPGFVLTVEPGLYFIPQLIDEWRKHGKFKDVIEYDRLEDYYDFGGIRIEDNILVNPDGPQVLGPPIPKTVSEIEAIRSKALEG